MAKSLKVAPPDLTRVAARNGGKFPLPRIQRIISGEEPGTAGHGTRAMPVWGPIFGAISGSSRSPEVQLRITNLARYLGTLQVK